MQVSLGAGCDAHLAKPISKGQLIDALQKFGVARPKEILSWWRPGARRRMALHRRAYEIWQCRGAGVHAAGRRTHEAAAGHEPVFMALRATKYQ
jgi:hypothetical protein